MEMTRNSSLKKDVRARMAATGENYTTALRAITGGNDGGALSPVASALTQGTVTIAVCGGGMSNTALMLPEMLRLARAGHPLVIRPGQREGITELPSVVDLAVLAGTLPLDQAAAVANDDLAALLAAVEKTKVAAIYLDGSMLRAELVSQIEQLQSDYGKPAMIWVQDVQVAGAVAIPGDAEPDDQVAALLDVARQSGAIIAGGHCMPSEYEPGWEDVAAAASEAFVIDWVDDGAIDPCDGPRDGVLIHVVGGIRTDTIPWRVDHRPFSWRHDYLTLPQAR